MGWRTAMLLFLGAAIPSSPFALLLLVGTPALAQRVPVCPSVLTGHFPQISGLRVTYICDGLAPVVTYMWGTPQAIGGPKTPIEPTDAVRLVTSGFLAGGGHGYTAFLAGSGERIRT